jgi:hypothetical protein
MRYHSQSEVYLLPWAGPVAKVRVGPIEVWPWSASTARSVQNPALRAHLKCLLSRFVDNRGNRVDSIAICSHTRRDFRQLADCEDRDLRRAVDALVLATLAPSIGSGVVSNNRGLAPPSADRFELTRLRFDTGEEHIAVSEGSLTQVWRLDEISFARPWSVGGGFGWRKDDLLAALGSLLTDGPDDLRRRVFQALEWFRLAHTERANVSELSKVVMMTTALEIVLDVPKGQGRSEFCRRCEALFGDLKLHCQTRDAKVYSLARWWAWTFYELRSDIVHGNEVPFENLRYGDSDLTWVTHPIVADLVLLLAIERALIEAGHYAADVRRDLREGFDLDQCSGAADLDTCAAIGSGSYRAFRSLGWTLNPLAEASPDSSSIQHD